MRYTRQDYVKELFVGIILRGIEAADSSVEELKLDFVRN